ncbi:MAG: DUF4215 domain-containing protein [Deltaproteobacteria bacterium]|nr:DUF4215 domain-containing protein [Deltaproteobacteria bacterium]
MTRLLSAALWLTLFLPAATVRAGSQAYIANFSSDTVTVIDTGSNRITGRIPVGHHPWGVAVNPAGTRVYVTNQNDATLSVIDTLSETVSATIHLDGPPILFTDGGETALVSPWPYSAAVDPSGNTVYVTGPYIQSSDGIVWAINAANNTIRARIAVGHEPYGVLFSPDGRWAYVSNHAGDPSPAYNDGTVSVIDTATDTAVDLIQLHQDRPTALAISADGARLYVANWGGSISIIDTAQRRVMNTIPLGQGLAGLALSPDGNRLYVGWMGQMRDPSTCFGCLLYGVATAIDLQTNQVVANVDRLGSGPRGIALNPSGSRLFVPDYFSDGSVFVIDTASMTVASRIALPIGSAAVAFGQFMSPEFVCGNGVRDPGERCDDGNVIDGDDCDSNCQLTGCGNGATSPGEECDDFNNTSGDGCTADCRLEEGWACPPQGGVCHTVCGDGLVRGAEQCDDGDTLDGNGCEANCTPSYCGNAIIDSGEDCDYGIYNSPLFTNCEANCTLPRCGNGIRDILLFEQCDDGNNIDGDGCEANCTLPACGNGILDVGEQCDDGNRVDGDSCDSNCTPPVCGNAIVDAGEQCDDGNADSGDGCSATCQIEYIAGGGAPATDCLMEWAVVNPQNRRGPLSSQQVCRDNDPTCDFDSGVIGQCTFHVSACANVADAKLVRCQRQGLLTSDVQTPTLRDATRSITAAVMRGRIFDATTRVLSEAFGTCSAAVDIVVPLQTSAKRSKAGHQTLKAAVRAANGRVDKDKLRLTCLP